MQMQIFVMWDEKINSIEVKPDFTVKMLKEKIKDKLGIETSDQTLLFKRGILRDNISLFQYDIQEGNVLTLFTYLPIKEKESELLQIFIKTITGKEITLSIIRNHPINKDASAGGIMRDNIAYSNNSYQTHDEEKLDIKVIPEGSMGSAKIGIGLAPNNYDYTKLPLGTAIQRGCEDAINIIAQTIDGLYRMITGQTKADVAGPVKIMKMIKDQSSKGWTDLFYLTALLSVNIGLLNLLPLPVLDGGRIVFVLLDVLFSIFNKIFKTKLVVNQKVEESIHFVGMICLILLMIYVTFKDVISFF